MTAKELRQKYLEFFKSKNHSIISSASLIPENDPTVLFTTAGMHPLVPYLLGEPHPEGTRLADAQKCIRTGDIEEVGDETHHTFFEMMGNWSLGDYFKKEAIEWSFEFLTSADWLGLDPQRIYVSVFEGDDDAPFDEEAAELWKEQFAQVGITATVYEPGKDNTHARIFALGKKDNWWGPAGQTGPCGPDTEMFYKTTEGAVDIEEHRPGFGDDGFFVEIWNDVFMQYNKNEQGNFEQLKKPNVDTGMGLERTVAALNGFSDNYLTDLFQPIIQKIEALSNKKYAFTPGDLGYEEMPECWATDKKSMRIIADHVRSAVFIIGDDRGVAPSNVDQGYVVRRLIRRAVRFGRNLGIDSEVLMTVEVARVVIEHMKDIYPELERNKQFIIDSLTDEEQKFAETLAKGLKEFQRISGKIDNRLIEGMDAFNLFATYGFPLEITRELAEEQGMRVDEEGFLQEFKKHQDLSRAGAEAKFKGGLADHSETTVKYHTATHLLHAALRKILGDHVGQKGSNITSERMRFDFSHPAKMTDEEKQQVEDLVNSAIERDYPVSWTEMTVEEAKEKGAIGLFEDRYGAKVKVYTVGDPDAPVDADPSAAAFSREICGGPHVEHTGTIGHFKITKEEAVSAGVRRIKAIIS